MYRGMDYRREGCHVQSFCNYIMYRGLDYRREGCYVQSFCNYIMYRGMDYRREGCYVQSVLFSHLPLSNEVSLMEIEEMEFIFQIKLNFDKIVRLIKKTFLVLGTKLLLHYFMFSIFDLFLY